MEHAFLIIAHNEFDILHKMISFLDHKTNDIFVHVDIKAKEFNQKLFKTTQAGLFFIERKSIVWGAYSQVDCEYRLLKFAIANGDYDYYHLLSGVDLPIKSYKEIYQFFLENKGKEFIHFDNFAVPSFNRYNRVRYKRYLLQKFNLNSSSLKSRTFRFFERISIFFQKIFMVDIFKKHKVDLYAGSNWFSITDRMVQLLINNEYQVKRLFQYSLSADELFVQTILKKEIEENMMDIVLDNKRYIDWTRAQPYTFTMEDFDTLMNSDKLFARKFSSQKDRTVIDKIFKTVSE